MAGDPDYVLGHSDLEIERLQFQARVIEGVTRRLIRESGVGPGMRALDIGCGVGDVAMLLADAVGESGVVVGIDREPRAIETARARAAKAGYRQIDFAVSSDEGLLEYPPFDAAMGRYVLIHQQDPAAMVRRVAAAVRSGGIVAFHELAAHIAAVASPAIDLFREVAETGAAGCRATLPSFDVGARLVACFEEAGLGEPNLIWELIAGGPSSPVIPWLAMTYRAFLPAFMGLGLEQPKAIGDAETLETRLLASATAARAQLLSPPQACAWARRD